MVDGRPQPSDAWQCVCWSQWNDPDHLRLLEREPGGIFRDKLCHWNPMNRWIRENLPRDRFVRAADDGILRIYSPADPKGQLAAVEIKTRNKTLDNATGMIFAAYSEPGRFLAPIVITMDGTVPTPLHHFPVLPGGDYHSIPDRPVPCREAIMVRLVTGYRGSPDRPEPAFDRIMVEPHELADWLLEYLESEREIDERHVSNWTEFSW